LIQNGIQASRQGKQPKITVEMIKEVKSVEIKFIDNGKGIPESIQSKVFEPKFTTKTKGMGLGLGIVKNIIDSHNGTIKYETGKKGTTFLINLALSN
jgi:signal transduction histidine kinase